jgi:hypothetical protein
LDWFDSGNQNSARILLVLNATAVAITVLGQGVLQTLNMRPKLWIWVIAVLAIVGIQILLWRNVGSRTVHSFRERTPEFSSFFSSWYAQDGQHTVYCSDLEWLEHPEHAEILRTLMRRATRIEIIVRDDSSPICSQLRQQGLVIHTIPENTYTLVRMSLHQSDDQERVIIRRKITRQNQENIVFVETEDSYIVALAKDLFANCKSALPGP